MYSRGITISAVLNKLGKDGRSDVYRQPTGAESVQPDDEHAAPLHAATIIRQSIIEKCQIVRIQPIETDALTASNVRSVIPDTLYRFLHLLISNKDRTTASAHAPISETDERHICAIAHGRVKMPKDVGFAMSVRHMTGCKQLITMLNRFGHCSSYDITEVMDINIANEIVAKSSQERVVTFSNIMPGPFIQVAGDNKDINEEIRDGKGTRHATTMVLFQREPLKQQTLR